MYYLYLKHGSDFRYPDRLIVEYDNSYFERKKQTDWALMSQEEIGDMLSGKDNRYYSVDENQFHAIIAKWGGSENGYQRLNIHNMVKTSNYGESYDEEDEK